MDNASSDGSADMVHREFADVVLIRNPENVGFAKANNQAFERSRGAIVGLLNADAELLNDSFGILIDRLDRNPSVGVAGPLILRPDGAVDRSCARRCISLGTGVRRCSWVG